MKLTIISAVAVLFFGCQDTKSTESNAQVTSSQVSQSFESKEYFPKCDPVNEGSIAFSRADKSFYVCSNGEYVSAEDGRTASEGETSKGSTLGATKDCADAVSSIPSPTGVTGQLMITLPSDVEGVDPCSLSGYVVGHQADLKIQTTKNGEYFVNNVPPGEQDLIVTAGALQIGDASKLALTNNAPSFGIRMNELRSTSGLRNNVGEIVLPPLSEISGTARLVANSATDHAGISVFIPGTGYIAFTDSDGKYTIKDVPAGAHSLYFEKDGFARGQVEGFVVAGGSTVSAPQVELYLDAGISGSFSVVNSVVVNNKTIVLGSNASLLMAPSNGAVLMLLGDGQSAAAWQSVRTNYSWEYAPEYFLRTNQWGYTPSNVDSPSSAALIAKFANANGLESDAISKTVYVDFFSNGITRFTPQFNASINTSPKRIEVTSIQIPALAEEMTVVHQRPNEGWLAPTFGPTSTSKTINLLDTLGNCGTHTINVQFRGYGGKVYSSLTDGILSSSPTFAQSLINSCHSTVPTNSSIASVGVGDIAFADSFYGVWTGSEVVVFGWDSANTFSGSRYNPTSSSWSSAISTANAPVKRTRGETFAIGGKVVFANGLEGSSASSHFNVYDPVGDTWSANSGSNAPDFSTIESGKRRIFALGGKLHMVYLGFLTSSEINACDLDSSGRVDENTPCDGDGDDNNQTNNPEVTNPNVSAMHYVSYDPAVHSWTTPVVLSRRLALPRTQFYLAGYDDGTQLQLAIMGGQFELSGSDNSSVDRLSVNSGTVTAVDPFPNLPHTLSTYDPTQMALFDEGTSGFSIFKMSDPNSGFKVYTYSSTSNSWIANTVPQSLNSQLLSFSPNRPGSLLKSGDQITAIDYNGRKLQIIKLTNTSTPASFVTSRFSSLPRYSSESFYTAVNVAIPGQGIFIWGGKYNDPFTNNPVTVLDGAIVRTTYADQFN
jgi:hypothetical protein